MTQTFLLLYFREGFRFVAGSTVGAQQSLEGGPEHFHDFLMPVSPSPLIDRKRRREKSHQEGQ